MLNGFEIDDARLCGAQALAALRGREVELRELAKQCKKPPIEGTERGLLILQAINYCRASLIIAEHMEKQRSEAVAGTLS